MEKNAGGRAPEGKKKLGVAANGRLQKGQTTPAAPCRWLTAARPPPEKRDACRAARSSF